MDLKLKVLLGKNAGQLLPVPGPKFFVGRAEDCQLRPKSDLVSRHHCVLMVEESFAAVRDFGSRNGTHVNGERIVGERELKSGDHLVIGALEFEVVLSETPAVTKRPRVNSIKEAAARTVAGPLQPSGDASQWLLDGDNSDGETVADTAALTMADTEQIPVPPAAPVPPATPVPQVAAPAPVSPAPVPPAPVSPAPVSPSSTAETVHPGMAAAETVVPPAVPAAPAPAAPAPVAPAPTAPVAPVAAAPAVPQVAAAPAPAVVPAPAVPAPNYYVPPAHEPGEGAAGESSDEQESDVGKSGKKKPGKLPPLSKFSGEDSREAAADTLRKFFQRR